MKEITELLNNNIANETKSVETMCHSFKEDELTILRLQNRVRAIEKKIEECEQLIQEYKGHLGRVSKSTYTKTKLMPARSRHRDMDTSITRIKSIESLEKHS